MDYQPLVALKPHYIPHIWRSGVELEARDGQLVPAQDVDDRHVEGLLR